MKFCPECGTILLPEEKGKGIKLVCPNCGRWKKLKKEEDYKIDVKKKEKRSEKVTVIEKKKKKRYEEPEYDIDMDAYAELYESY